MYAIRSYYEKANKNSYPFLSLNTLPRNSRITNLMMMSSTTKPIICVGLSISKLKLMLAPTEIKNSPSKSPLNGSIVVSSSCRYSLSARTTPAIKVPKAGDKPIFSMAMAIPITSNRARATNTSCNPVPAINRNIV